MKKINEYIEKLMEMKDWEAYLMEESNLPGPRANLELVQAAAEAGDEERFLKLISYTPEKAPVNSTEEFLALCGTVGLGKLINMGKHQYLDTLRNLASDPRWRLREGVAMALQIFGESNMDKLICEMEKWAMGNPYEKRAAMASLCEPKLLGNKVQALRVLGILDEITKSILNISDRKSEEFAVLKKGLAYCWSVAIVHNPEEGKVIFEGWTSCQDKDIKWIIKENLKKDRLKRMDSEWVQRMICLCM